jgi:predicted nucleic acid-binding protein
VKLFLDANVLFTAAHNPHGKAAFVIELAREGCWKVATSRFALEEARRNLEVKFPEAVDVLDELMRDVVGAPTAPDEPCPIDLPEKDRPIFLSAIEGRCTHLLTGDRKDFGRFMNDPEKTAGIVIQTVGDFLSAL